MDVRLSAQIVDTQRHVVMIEPALIIHFELEQITAQYLDEIPYLTFNTEMKMTNRWFTSGVYSNSCQMVLLDLHGTLVSGNNTYGQGAALLSKEGLPLRFYEDREQLVQLTFSCHSQYIQQLEQDRATTMAGQDLRIALRFWGSIMVMDNFSVTDPNYITPNPQDSADRNIHYQQLRDIVPLLTSQNAIPTLRIPRSDWLDRLLPALGYGSKRFVAFPQLSDMQLPSELGEAVKHLTTARTLFDHERYREAIQLCRQSRDALLGQNKTTWCQTYLEPIIGSEKAAMIDKSIQALNHLGNPASHGGNTIEIDRDAAEFVLSSLTLVLHYIEKKLK